LEQLLSSIGVPVGDTAEAKEYGIKK